LSLIFLSQSKGASQACLFGIAELFLFFFPGESELTLKIPHFYYGEEAVLRQTEKLSGKMK
jgi:hypothetical protein